MAIYYIIPDLYRSKKFTFLDFIRNIKKLSLMKYMKSVFFTHHKPAGGIKVIYQHCLLLKASGFDVYPVQMGAYQGNYFDYDLDFKKYEDIADNLSKSDIIVATEFLPYQGLIFKNAQKVLFFQNWIGLRIWLKNEDKGKNYLELGYDHVITCSKYCSDYVSKNMHIPTTTITNGIDLSLFRPEHGLRIKNRILAMSRKNLSDLKKIMGLMSDDIYEFRIVDGLSQNELIKEYQAADIFLATGYPEGFGLPALEAMACGCVVVGFTGGGASEFMIDGETSLNAEDGDVDLVVKHLKLLACDSGFKERIRVEGYQKSLSYGLDSTAEHLNEFFGKLVGK